MSRILKPSSVLSNEHLMRRSSTVSGALNPIAESAF